MAEPQIDTETEVHRRHVRLRIPVGVEIDGVRYVTDDWSVGGFGVLADLPGRRPGDRFTVRMVLPFEDFEIVLPVDCELVYINDDPERFGCRFLGLSRGQLELFRFITDAYLSGEMVSAGDVLAVVARTGESPQLRPLLEEEGGRLRRWLGHAALVLVAVLLAGVAGLGIWQRWFVITTEEAVIWTPLVTLEAPLAGRVVAAPARPIYRPGDIIARIEALDERVVFLESPCECAVVSWKTLPGQYAAPGEPVVVLADANEPLLVRARLPVRDALRLEVGQRAQVWLPGEAEPRLAQITRIDFRPDLARLGQGEGDIGPRKALVFLRPDRPFDFDRLGSLVRVRFL